MNGHMCGDVFFNSFDWGHHSMIIYIVLNQLISTHFKWIKEYGLDPIFNLQPNFPTWVSVGDKGKLSQIASLQCLGQLWPISKLWPSYINKYNEYIWLPKALMVSSTLGIICEVVRVGDNTLHICSLYFLLLFFQFYTHIQTGNCVYNRQFTLTTNLFSLPPAPPDPSYPASKLLSLQIALSSIGNTSNSCGQVMQ